jgi:transposase
MPVAALPREIDAASLERFLERIAPRLLPDENALALMIVATLLGVIKEVREKSATISRLRRLLGISNSEKTAVVFGRKRSSDTEQAPAGDGDAPESHGSAPMASESSAARVLCPEVGREEASPRERRKGHGRRGVAAYPHAHHVPVPHESLRPGGRCPECGRGTLLELEPAHWLRIVGLPPLAAECSCLQRLRCCPCGAVFTAKAPEEANGSKMTPSAVAQVAVLHYLGGMPYHRLERLQENLETPLPAATQSEAVAGREADIRPVLEELENRAARAGVFYLDDTRGPVLEFMGKRRAAAVESGTLPDPERCGLFTTGLVATDEAEHKLALFMTGRKHAGENVAEILKRRPPELPPPVLMSDALSWNAPRDHIFVEAHCIPHARRYFVDQATNHPEECQYVLEKLEQVFRVEAKSRRDRLSPQQRLVLHQRESGPVMDQLEAWMKAQFEQKRVEPNSGLGHAFNYMLKRWPTFTVFLRTPGAPLENNTAERALKAAIRHRRNSLFYRSARGARVGDSYMSLLYTAELNGENPLAYLTALLSQPAAVAECPAEWLPWNYRATLARIRETLQPAGDVAA